MLELEGREWRVTVETGILSEPLLQDCLLEKQVLPLSHPAPQRVILFLNLSHCLLIFFFFKKVSAVIVKLLLVARNSRHHEGF